MYLYVLYTYSIAALILTECVVGAFLWKNPARTAPALIDTGSIQSMQAGKIDGYLLAVFFIKDQLNRDLTLVVIDLHLL